MPSFPSTPLPDTPLDEEAAQTAEVLVSPHRDGSEQRRKVGDGRGRRFTLRWTYPLTRAERDSIISHYNGQDGMLTAFQWAHPETAEAITVRYDGPPQSSQIAYDAHTMTVTFQEVAA